MCIIPFLKLRSISQEGVLSKNKTWFFLSFVEIVLHMSIAAVESRMNIHLLYQTVVPNSASLSWYLFLFCWLLSYISVNFLLFSNKESSFWFLPAVFVSCCCWWSYTLSLTLIKSKQRQRKLLGCTSLHIWSSSIIPVWDVM